MSAKPKPNPNQVGHVCPEAAVGGPIALVRARYMGDMVDI